MRPKATTPNHEHIGDGQRITIRIVFPPLLTAVVAQFFDFGTFLVMVHRHGLNAEGNPIVAAIAASVGVEGLAVVKSALVLFVAGVAVMLAGPPRSVSRERMAGATVGLAILAGVFGGLTNALAFGPL
jgi:hypothetical protein